MRTEQDVIAIIDDDEGIRKALKRLLSAKGYRTELYSSATEFLSALPTSQAGCHVVDIHLADDSGIQLVRLLEAKNASRPTIFITASTDSLQRVEALMLGCIAYLIKPLGAKQLLTAIELATRSKSKG